MTDIRGLKSKAILADEPLRTLVLSLPDEIPQEDIISKMDVFLKMLDIKNRTSEFKNDKERIHQ